MLEPVVREPILAGNITISGVDTEQAQAIATQLSVPDATIVVKLAP